MFLKQIWYLVMVLFVLTPVVLLDTVVGRINSGGWQFIVRMVLFVLAFLVFRLIPSPKHA